MSAHYLGRSSAASVITRSCLLSWFALEKCLLNPRHASQDLRAMPPHHPPHEFPQTLATFRVRMGTMVPLSSFGDYPGRSVPRIVQRSTLRTVPQPPRKPRQRRIVAFAERSDPWGILSIRDYKTASNLGHDRARCENPGFSMQTARSSASGDVEVENGHSLGSMSDKVGPKPAFEGKVHRSL